MGMGWTTRQQASIDTRNANVLVSAAAGSGKTAVLTERVFRRILGSEQEQGISIDRFLIVTFTSAAANEMKERIASKLQDAIEELQEGSEQVYQQEQIKHLERQLALIGQASISTIHSFCLKIIKNYFNSLDIDPNIKVGNESDLYLMKLDLLEELLESLFEEEGNDAFLELADTYGSVRGLEPLMELILDVHTFSKSTVFPELWLDEMKSQLVDFDETIGANTYDHYLLTSMLEELFDLETLYQEALDLMRRPDGPAVYEDNFKEDLACIQEVTCQLKDKNLNLTKEEWQKLSQGLLDAISKISFGRLKSKKDDSNPVLKNQVKGYRDLAKDIVKGIQEKVSLLTDQMLRKQTKQAGRCIETLVEVVKAFDTLYQKAKKEKTLVDYNDLEHMCLKLLVDKKIDEEGNVEIIYTEIAKELAGFYEEIYIDEYQDSNKVQEMLLGSIAQAKDDGPTRFMVGDMKQSIYRFRLANPLIFAEKYNTFEKYKEGEDVVFKERKDLVIDLSQNFRSRQMVLDSVNDLFEQTMSEKIGELAYDEEAKLKVGNLYDQGEAIVEDVASTMALHLIETKEGEGGEEELLEDLKGIEQEAKMVAQIISDLLQGKENPKQVFDKDLGNYRDIEPRDIVILLRSVQDKANLFETALLEKGIDAYADVSGGFFEASEIQLMLALLQTIDNPRQDIPLLSVLRSPIVRCDFDELLLIRKYQEEVDFYTALCIYIEDGKGSDTLRRFFEQLKVYRDESSLMPLEAFIAYLLRDTSYYRYVSMLPAGAKKKANLKLFKRHAESFEASNGVGVFGFLQYMLKLKETKAKIGEAKLVGENENLVRIMTIHKSKGLEFPIVFVSNTNKKFNNQDIMKNVLMHHELGFGPKYTDQRQHMLYETIPFHAVKEKIINENISEEIRVLYVALTRAKEKLFITGAVKDMQKEIDRWGMFGRRQTSAILPLGLRRSPSYLQWIGSSLYAHKKLDTLRNLAGETCTFLYDGNAEWDVRIWHQDELVTQQETQDMKRQERQEALETWDTTKIYSEMKEVIQERLNYRYPHEQAITLPIKVAVSELKKKNQEIITGYSPFSNDEKKVPSFMANQQEMKATTRGTLIHSVFEQVDFSVYKSYEEINKAIEELISLGKLQEEVKGIVSCKKLMSVAHSTLQKRMEEAQYVWREKAFVYLVSASEIDETYPKDEEMLIQGVVDTCFLEEDGIVIVDYKTDYIDPSAVEEGIEKMKNRYTIQLELYGKALGAIMNKCVKEKWLYLYSIDQWVEIS